MEIYRRRNGVVTKIEAATFLERGGSPAAKNVSEERKGVSYWRMPDGSVIVADRCSRTEVNERYESYLKDYCR